MRAGRERHRRVSRVVGRCGPVLRTQQRGEPQRGTCEARWRSRVGSSLRNPRLQSSPRALYGAADGGRLLTALPAAAGAESGRGLALLQDAAPEFHLSLTLPSRCRNISRLVLLSSSRTWQLDALRRGYSSKLENSACLKNCIPLPT